MKKIILLLAVMAALPSAAFANTCNVITAGMDKNDQQDNSGFNYDKDEFLIFNSGYREMATIRWASGGVANYQCYIHLNNHPAGADLWFLRNDGVTVNMNSSKITAPIDHYGLLEMLPQSVTPKGHYTMNVQCTRQETSHDNCSGVNDGQGTFVTQFLDFDYIEHNDLHHVSENASFEVTEELLGLPTVLAGAVATQHVIQWDVPYGVQCTAGGGWSGVKANSGSETVENALTRLEPVTYSLSCSDSSGRGVYFSETIE